MSLNLERLAEYPVVALDCETTGLHWYRNDAFGVAIAAYDGKDIHTGYFDIRERPRIIDLLRGEVPRCQKVVNHNMKFDSHFLRKQGVMVPLDRIECTSVRAALINEHEPSFSLDNLSKKYTGRSKVDIYDKLAALFGGAPTRAVQMKNLHRAPASLVGEYAAPDPELAILLWLWQEEEIVRQGLQKVWNLERQLTPVLIEMEEHGVRVDEERAEKSLVEIDRNVNQAQMTLNKLAGKDVNVNSSPQMRALFGCNKVDADNGRGFNWTTDSGFVLEVTDGGQPSMNKDALEALGARGDARAGQILTIRKMLKAKSFLKDHIIGHAVGGRVYPNYNQTRGDNDLGTGTGRFSIDDPALQQIPARDREVASIVRACFLPEKGHSWVCADWDQFEFRWFAHYTKDPNVLKVYEDNPNADYHQVVADLTGLPRSARRTGDANAKQINLGLVFGMGQGTMAYEMGLPYTTRWDPKHNREWQTAGPEAMEIFEKYHTAIPGVKKLLSQASSIAKSRGHVLTVMERHIRFPGGKFTHKAGGLVFQGSSADCMKQKMIELHPVAKKEGFHMLLSVHDELDFSVPSKKEAKHIAMIKKSLETFDGDECPIQCRVPIRSSVAVGPNWWEGCK
jgi:DNA polymerase I-like protein with 3'-5' exonuclease and polymerase domains